MPTGMESHHEEQYSTPHEVEEIVECSSFKYVTGSKRVKKYLTFLSEGLAGKLKLPYVSHEEDFEILRAIGREVYSLSYALPGGLFGNSVSFIEKGIGVLSATRNWNTVCKRES